MIRKNDALPAPPPGSRVIDTGYVRFWRGEDGIIYNDTYMQGRVEGLAMRKGLAAVANLSGGAPAPMLAMANQMGTASREAREALASPEARALISALAVVAPSPVARMVLSFFARVSRPPFPVRLFPTLESAQRWCRSLGGDQAVPETA